MNPTSKPKSDTAMTRQHKPARFRWKRILGLSIVFLALITPGIVGFLLDRQQDRESPASPAAGGTTKSEIVDYSGPAKAVRSRLEQARAKASIEEVMVWQDFQKDLKALQRKNREQLDAGRHNAVETLLQADQLAWLVINFAHDKLNGGSLAQDLITADSRAFFDAIRDSRTRTTELFERFQRDLERVNTRYAVNVGDTIEDARTELPKPTLDSLSGIYQKMPTMVSIEVIGATIAVAVEAAMIRTTVNSFIKLFGDVLAPQIAKVLGGLATAASDGPLPFGDIVTGGLFAWTVYDVATLPGEIRGDVTESFQKASDGYLKDLDGQMADVIGQLSESCRNARNQTHEKLVRNLPLNENVTARQSASANR